MALQMELGAIGHLITVEKYMMRIDCFCGAEICRNVWEPNHPQLTSGSSYLSEGIHSSHPILIFCAFNYSSTFTSGTLKSIFLQPLKKFMSSLALYLNVILHVMPMQGKVFERLKKKSHICSEKSIC